MTPTAKALFDAEVGLRGEDCATLPVVTAVVGVSLVAGIAGAAVPDGETEEARELGGEVMATGPGASVPDAMSGVEVTPGAAVEMEDGAATWLSVSEAVGKGNDGTVAVPVYPGQPGELVLGGARPPPQSSN